ncbi:hypothetical protein CR152_23730 [Massilia violaceinigra]|uniref:Uncharacterized protein n=1 Tax=Massilia violaceinigra TaxID=2045208 RepID=A0A2D2DQD7_9BURK|nr:hypothetical protein [Massilia violaceinigra]ATQ77192.1 hypothetical protein CR152_23730 [Massilia violaceinigra]
MLNHVELSATPLLEIGIHTGGHKDLAREIAERFQNGRAQEVIDFIAECDVGTLRIVGLVRTASCIWRQDASVWRRFARMTGKRGVLWGGADDLVYRDAAFSEEMHAMGRQRMASAGTDPLALAAAREFMLSCVTLRLPYPGIARAEVVAMVDAHLALLREAGLEDDDNGHWSLLPLLECLDDPSDLIAVAGKTEHVFRQAIWAYRQRSKQYSARQRWLAWHDFFRQHPGYLDGYHDRVADPALIMRRWPHVTPQLRWKMTQTLLSAMPYSAGDDQDYFFDAVDGIIRHDEASFAGNLRKRTVRLDGGLASLIWRQQYPQLLPELFALIMCARHGLDPLSEPLNIILADEPALLLSGRDDSLPRVVAVLSAEVLRAVLPSLATLIGNGAAAELRAAVVEAAKKLDPADIAHAGWLASGNEHLRLACREILLAHPDQASASALLSRY